LKTDTPNEDDQGFFGALMISDEVYVEIKVLRKQGLSLRQIASEVGCAVNTLRAHLAAPEMPRYEHKAKRPSKLAPYETYLRERQAAAYPNWIPASVLYREIVAQGYADCVLSARLRTAMSSRIRWRSCVMARLLVGIDESAASSTSSLFDRSVF
jgi:transposase